MLNISPAKPKETDSDFGRLLKDYSVKVPNAGDLVKGKVLSVDNGTVRLDINGLVTGVVRGHELFSESNEFSNLKVGDEVEATVIEQENEDGEMELSFRSAGHQRVWGRVDELMKTGRAFASKVMDANRGGLMMQVDALVGFMPVSQLNPDHYPRVPGGDKNKIFEQLRKLVGLELQVKVIGVNQRDNKLIVSEKEVWEDEQKAVLDAYKIGDVIGGEVSALTSFGAFVRFGEGLEGLVHISEIVWQRIDHPRDVLKVGDQVKVQIIDLNRSKIYLSLKRLVEDPWKAAKDKYKVGQVVAGVVHKIEPFGLMIRLDEDIHGLAHVSELFDTPVPGMDKIKDKFKVGESYQFEIVNIEPAEHRLGLKLEGVRGKTDKKEAKAASLDREEKKDEAGEQTTDASKGDGGEEIGQGAQSEALAEEKKVE